MLRSVYRSRLPRGKTWLTFFLARRLKSLQKVPIATEDGDTLYVDLRIGTSHSFLSGSKWEADEQQAISRVVRQGDVAFDVGGYIGVHTLLLSRLVGAAGRVFTFEPNAGIFNLLEQTVIALENVTLFSFALSDEAGDSFLYVPDTPEYASLADWTKGRVPERARRLPCGKRRMDDLVDAGVIPFPDFIKCDVEGAEPLVFRGGAKCLDRGEAPVILFESNVYTSRGFGFTAGTAMEFLAGLSAPCYSFFQVGQGGTLTRIESADQIHANILAVPRAREDRLAPL